MSYGFGTGPGHNYYHPYPTGPIFHGANAAQKSIVAQAAQATAAQAQAQAQARAQAQAQADAQARAYQSSGGSQPMSIPGRAQNPPAFQGTYQQPATHHHNPGVQAWQNYAKVHEMGGYMVQGTMPPQGQQAGRPAWPHQGWDVARLGQLPTYHGGMR